MRPNDIALSNVHAPGMRGHRLAAGVGETRLREAVRRNRAGADEAVLRLEEDVHARRNVVGDQRRNADAEVHEHAVAKLAGDALGDDGLRIHGQALGMT